MSRRTPSRATARAPRRPEAARHAPGRHELGQSFLVDRRSSITGRMRDVLACPPGFGTAPARCDYAPAMSDTPRSHRGALRLAAALLLATLIGLVLLGINAVVLSESCIARSAPDNAPTDTASIEIEPVGGGCDVYYRIADGSRELSASAPPDLRAPLGVLAAGTALAGAGALLISNRLSNRRT